jgi:hypothetical protein
LCSDPFSHNKQRAHRTRWLIKSHSVLLRLRIGGKRATAKSTKKTLQNTTHTKNRTTDSDPIPDMVICERLDPIHTSDRDSDSTSYQAHLVLHCKPVLTNCAANTIAWKAVEWIAHRATARGATGSILVENAPRVDIATPAASSSSSSSSSSNKANIMNELTRAPVYALFNYMQSLKHQFLQLMKFA